MNIREAILLAADHIERNPHEFNYDSASVPESAHCGTPGCAVGWVASYLGIGFRQAIVKLVGINDGCEFYDRMAALVGRGWMNDAAVCAAGLREYADNHFPAPKRAGIPADVRAIFETQQTEVA